MEMFLKNNKLYRIHPENGFEIAIAHTNTHGSGWSSSHPYIENMEINGEANQLILAYLNQESVIINVREKLETIFGTNYLNGLKHITITWIRHNTKYRITEYDGLEAVELYDDVIWKTT